MPWKFFWESMMHPDFKTFLSTALTAALLLSAPVLHAEKPDNNPTISLSAEASASAPNDLGRAQLYFEDTDRDTAALAERVNAVISQALETARSETAVDTQSSGTSTYPVRNNEEQQIENWRMRSTIQLESRDTAALARLVGELQKTLAVGSLTMQPAPETRDKAADDAALEAVEAFQARAETLATALGKNYRLRDLNVQYPGMPPVRPMLRMAAADSTGAAFAPIEAGQSEISVSVSGTIELIQ